jgi:hypothetical protein
MDDGEAGRRICGRAERFSEEARDVVSDGSSSRLALARLVDELLRRVLLITSLST